MWSEQLRASPPATLSARLTQYHAQERARLDRQPVTLNQQMLMATGGGFKGGGGGFTGFAGQAPLGIEGPLVRTIAGAPVPTMPTPTGPLAERPELFADGAVNERLRRAQIHAHLASRGRVQPEVIQRWLFRDVLHVDLDDPLLGLGTALTANYPFAAEDAEP